MGRLLVIVVAVVPLLGCKAIYRSMTFSSRAEQTKAAAARVLDPPCTQEFKIEEIDTDYGMPWRVQACGAVLDCRPGTKEAYFCFKHPPRVKDFLPGDWPTGFDLAGAEVSKQTGCPAEETRVDRLEDGVTWSASNCAREFVCSLLVDEHGIAQMNRGCEETPLSKERTARRISVDRLVLETGCPAEKVAMMDTAYWTRGTERAYRFDACGAQFVCTTAAGRTDCKAALQAQPVTPVGTEADAGR